MKTIYVTTQVVYHNTSNESCTSGISSFNWKLKRDEGPMCSQIQMWSQIKVDY
jgi:hypothetical protein